MFVTLVSGNKHLHLQLSKRIHRCLCFDSKVNLFNYFVVEYALFKVVADT